jgi:endonuclease III
MLRQDVTASGAVNGDPGQARFRFEGGKMSYSDTEVFAVTSTIDKYRGGEEGEVGSALVVVGLSAEKAAKEVRIRDDMIRVAHRSGASIRQLADVSGLGRKTVTAIVSSEARLHD